MRPVPVGLRCSARISRWHSRSERFGHTGINAYQTLAQTVLVSFGWQPARLTSSAPDCSSANLANGLARSPAVVRCPNDGLETVSERETQSICKRHAAAPSPCDSSLFGILDRDRLKLQVVARQQRAR